LDNIKWADWYGDVNKIIYNKCNLNLIGLNWADWKDGMSIISSVSFYDDSHEEIIYIFSNEILLTKELFSYICHFPFEVEFFIFSQCFHVDGHV
jgi:hypothetical protein